MKQTLQNLLAEGKTAQVLAELRKLTTSDVTVHQEVLQISARFAEYERQKRLGIAEDAPLSIERNKINAALIFLIDKLPHDDVSDKTTPSVKEGKTIIQNAEKIYNIDHIDNANFS